SETLWRGASLRMDAVMNWRVGLTEKRYRRAAASNEEIDLTQSCANALLHLAHTDTSVTGGTDAFPFHPRSLLRPALGRLCHGRTGVAERGGAGKADQDLSSDAQRRQHHRQLRYPPRQAGQAVPHAVQPRQAETRLPHLRRKADRSVDRHHQDTRRHHPYQERRPRRPATARLLRHTTEPRPL